MSRVCGKSFTNAVTEGGIYRHIPCPKLFALRNGYQVSDIALSWDIFMEKGYGHCIPYRKLRNLWEEIVETCEEERAAWTFTRDNTWKPKVNNTEDTDLLEENHKEIDEGNLNEDDSSKSVPQNSNF